MRTELAVLLAGVVLGGWVGATWAERRYAEAVEYERYAAVKAIRAGDLIARNPSDETCNRKNIERIDAAEARRGKR